MFFKSLEFCYLFIKITIREGVLSLLWGQLIPFITFVTLNFKWFYHKPDINSAIPIFCAFWSLYIVNLFLFGVSFRISIFRESGFLRNFTYIAGSKAPIIFGLYLVQILYGLVLLTVFTVITSMIFRYNTLFLLVISYLTFIVVALPLFMLMLFFPTLSVSTSNLYSVANMLIFPSTFITMYRGEIGNFFVNFCFGFNPIEYVYKMAMIISGKWFSVPISNDDYKIVFYISAIYIVIGLFCWKRIKLMSTVART